MRDGQQSQEDREPDQGLCTFQGHLHYVMHSRLSPGVHTQICCFEHAQLRKQASLSKSSPCTKFSSSQTPGRLPSLYTVDMCLKYCTAPLLYSDSWPCWCLLISLQGASHSVPTYVQASNLQPAHLLQAVIHRELSHHPVVDAVSLLRLLPQQVLQQKAVVL